MRFGVRHMSGPSDGAVAVASAKRSPRSKHFAPSSTAVRQWSLACSVVPHASRLYKTELPTPRLAKVGEAAVLTIHHGFSGALAAHMHHPSCRRDVGRVPEEHEGQGKRI